VTGAFFGVSSPKSANDDCMHENSIVLGSKLSEM
jgi:hypothetical protein